MLTEVKGLCKFYTCLVSKWYFESEMDGVLAEAGGPHSGSWKCREATTHPVLVPVRIDSVSRLVETS